MVFLESGSVIKLLPSPSRVRVSELLFTVKVTSVLSAPEYSKVHISESINPLSGSVSLRESSGVIFTLNSERSETSPELLRTLILNLGDRDSSSYVKKPDFPSETGYSPAEMSLSSR